MVAPVGPMPVPARITAALDLRGLYGPEVDRALGGEEPMVDDWEEGKYLPTPEQVTALAELTHFPEKFFYLPVSESEYQHRRTFICDFRRRSENALTIVESWVDWDGVLHTEEVTPPRPPYRPRPSTPTPAVRRNRDAHVPREDPDAPGCCAVCRLPLNKPNVRHCSR